MKKWMWVGLAVLLAWNAMLTYQIYQKPSEKNPSPVEPGGSQIIQSNFDYTTDITSMIENTKGRIAALQINHGSSTSQASAVIFERENDVVYLLTAASLLESYDSLSVCFDNGIVLKAQEVFRDTDTGIALIKTEVTFETPDLLFGDSTLLQLGEYVVGMSGKTRTMETNIVDLSILKQHGLSLVNNESNWLADVITTGLAVDAQMLGGALLNVGGEVVGVLIDEKGHALAMAEIQKIYEDYKDSGKIERGALGATFLNIQDLEQYQKSAMNIQLDTNSGLYVLDILRQSPLRDIINVGDLIFKMDGEEIKNSTDLNHKLYGLKKDDIVTFTIYQKGEEKEVEVTLK